MVGNWMRPLQHFSPFVYEKKLSEAMNDAKRAGKLQVRKNGDAHWIITVPAPLDTVKTVEVIEVTYDPDRETVVGVEWHVSDQGKKFPWKRLTIQLTKTENGFWVPQRIDELNVIDNMGMRQEFKNVKINHPVADDAYSTTFPDNTIVVDHIAKKRYMTGRRAVDEEKAKASYEKLNDRTAYNNQTQKLDALIDKPAPALPAEGWLGGIRPDVAGKPYLLHFWASWCGACPHYVPRVKALAKSGLLVVGIHPAGTPAADVEKAMRKEDHGYATCLDQGKPQSDIIAGYPVTLMPTFILVDARGNVVAHGDIQEQSEIARLWPSIKRKNASKGHVAAMNGFGRSRESPHSICRTCRPPCIT